MNLLASTILQELNCGYVRRYVGTCRLPCRAPPKECVNKYFSPVTIFVIVCVDLKRGGGGGDDIQLTGHAYIVPLRPLVMVRREPRHKTTATTNNCVSQPVLISLIPTRAHLEFPNSALALLDDSLFSSPVYPLFHS